MACTALGRAIIACVAEFAVLVAVDLAHPAKGPQGAVAGIAGRAELAGVEAVRKGDFSSGRGVFADKIGIAGVLGGGGCCCKDD